MAPIQKTINHFTHPEHSLTVNDSNTKYLCDGCKIPGIGKRYHCHGCQFDLHEYCGKCPMNLSSFMHPKHSLNLVVRKPQANRQIQRICNVCCDTVEGLFYRCKQCEFDVHPLCTQLPETLRHALHQAHPLRLLGSSEPAGICVVCRGTCSASSWRYRCAKCGFDIHLGCVLVQCDKKTTHRGIPTYAPPSAFPPPQNYGGYAYGIPQGYPNPSQFCPSPSNMHHQYMPQPQHQSHGMQTQAQSSGQIGQMMFGLVKTLGVGVISNMIFGMDVSSFFSA